MEPIIIAGVIIVTLALIFYSIGIFTEQRQKRITKRILFYLSLGLIFDISATSCMIIGSANSAFTLHGFIGYTGLLAMIIETSFAYKHYKRHGSEKTVSHALHWYSRISYSLWVIVFITGGILVS
jgi:uncharacterized repeat protein (TIGR03987 family)